MDHREFEGSWRVGVGSVGYLSKGERGRLRPMRLAVDTQNRSQGSGSASWTLSRAAGN